MKNNCVSTLSLFGILTLLFGCTGSNTSLQATDSGEIPEWFLNRPEDPNYLYSSTSATSKDMQTAVDKAVQSARVEIGRQIEVKITAIQKRFQEETGIGNDAQLLDQFTQASKSVVSTSMSGTKEKQKKIVRDGSSWRAYVLVEYPLGAVQQSLKEHIKKQEQIYTRIRSTEVFKELEDASNKYEQTRK